MSDKLLPLIALLAFLSAPIVIGSAETAKDPVKESEKEVSKVEGKSSEAGIEKVVEAEPKKKLSNECLASEEVIADLEAREKKIKDQEGALKEREKEIAAQESALKQELAKLEAKRSEIRGVSEKEVAQREEQVNKLIETFEGMSPKAAAQVLGGVDDSLAVLALGRLTSLKAGKILGNLKPEKSARLSEMMAYGKTTKGKEGNRGDTHERTPANAEE
jgi:flagellar motility protein MotE (MotC chaperone)